MMEPIPVGTVVNYTGSLEHGRYVITQHQVPHELFTARELEIATEQGYTLSDAYPDGVAYVIWPEGMEQKYGNRAHSVWRVRRGSIEEVSDE